MAERAADKLAQVLAEHYEWHYAAGSECKRIACYGCAEEVEIPDLTNLTDDDADAAATRTFRAHVAAVVLAHLTAEGWAQGEALARAVANATVHDLDTARELVKLATHHA